MACEVALKPVGYTDLQDLRQLEWEAGLTVWTIEDYSSILGDSSFCFVEAKQNDRPVGFYLSFQNAPEQELLKIAVSPSRQRCGIGQKLLEDCFGRGLESGCARCFLEVRSRNEPALRFYLKHGFYPLQRRKEYYQSPADDALVLRKDLNRK